MSDDSAKNGVPVSRRCAHEFNMTELSAEQQGCLLPVKKGCLGTSGKDGTERSWEWQEQLKDWFFLSISSCLHDRTVFERITWLYFLEKTLFLYHLQTLITIFNLYSYLDLKSICSSCLNVRICRFSESSVVTNLNIFGFWFKKFGHEQFDITVWKTKEAKHMWNWQLKGRVDNTLATLFTIFWQFID